MPSSNKQALTYFIADLHLTQSRPDITACFLQFLAQEAVKAEKLYILGDLFESWIGDDDDSEFIITIAEALKTLSLTGTETYFIHGNRDFLLGKQYAEKAHIKLLNEIEQIELYGKKVVIMHGDTLCTRDIDYQKFRVKSRSWWWQTMIKSLPLFVRKKIAANYRKKSSAATSMKSQEIMDVTEHEVIKCLEKYHCQLLIHGHTHRPNVHKLTANQQEALRIVLGDWYSQGAWLKVTPDDMVLLNSPFDD